jgi:hypothetical protein
MLGAAPMVRTEAKRGEKGHEQSQHHETSREEN